MDEQTLADVPLSPHWVTSDRGPAMNTLTGRTSPPWLTVSIGVTRTDRSATVINKRTSSTCCPIVLPQAQLLFFVTAVKQLLQSMRRFRPCFVYMSMLGWLTDFVGPSQLVDFFFFNFMGWWGLRPNGLHKEAVVCHRRMLGYLLSHQRVRQTRE